VAVELAARAASLEVDLAPWVSPTPVDEILAAVANGDSRIGLASVHPLDAAALVALHRAADGIALPVAMPAGSLALARDLGLLATRDLGPFVASLALADAGVERPWEASTRGLASLDRLRLGGDLVGGREELRWERESDGVLALAHADGRIRVGPGADVADALRAARDRAEGAVPRMPTVEGVDPESVLEVILGPPRDLSDPASKGALLAYDVPLPQEVLCTSPSRAASEAAQIGFPVRLALASPDLRLWDHPDLVADGVDNAARVRDVFRQMMALGGARADRQRLLGVTVSATTSARALMRVEVASLAEGLARATLGFADPHGLAADDRTQLVLPADSAGIERALRRLRGHPLLLGDSTSVRREVVENLTDSLLRVAAFVNEWRAEVESVRIHPLAILLDGTIEARDVCIRVGDAFTRSLRNAAP